MGATPLPPKPLSPGILRIPAPDNGDPAGRLIPGMADDDSLDSASLDVVTKTARQVSAFMEDEVEDAAWHRLWDSRLVLEVTEVGFELRDQWTQADEEILMLKRVSKRMVTTNQPHSRKSKRLGLSMA